MPSQLPGSSELDAHAARQIFLDASEGVEVPGEVHGGMVSKNAPQAPIEAKNGDVSPAALDDAQKSTSTQLPVTLAELTTLRIGGLVKHFVAAQTEDELIRAIAEADAAGMSVLMIGGGSNLVADDAGFTGVVIQDQRRDIAYTRVGANDDDEVDTKATTVLLSATAGTIWDDFVRESLTLGLGGLEALSGIPGSVGAAPVQNIGAYGCEISDTLDSIRAWDRHLQQVVTLRACDLKLSYRNSAIKRSIEDPQSAEAAGKTWGPTGRWVVLDVTFALAQTTQSAPIQYKELAKYLGVDVGQRAQASSVREAVLTLRAGKGMVLNADDHDTWSAGSFFTNPILLRAEAESLLPPEAPRFAAGVDADGNELVKTSAAWLIDHSGLGKGWAPTEVCDKDGAPRASLSTKHVLALTNRGRAQGRDIRLLAAAVRAQVEEKFGITLVPEPVHL